MDNLQVKLISAQLSRDTEMFSNMDPYCFLILGKQKLRSRTKDEAGKKPVWNETFRFTATDNNLKIVVMDEDTFSDDKVGEGTIDVSQFRQRPASREVVQLYYAGKSAGKVILEIGGGAGQQGQWGQQGNQWQSQQNMSKNNKQWGNQSYQQGQQYPPPQQQWGSQSYQQPQQGNMGLSHKWGPQPPNQGWGGNQANPQSPWGDLNNNNGWGNFAPGGNNGGYQSNSNQPSPNPMAMLGNIFNGGMPSANNNGSNPYNNGNNPYGGNGGNPYQ